MTISTKFPRTSQPQDPTSIQKKYITTREENIVTLVGTDVSNMPVFAPGGVATAPTKIIGAAGTGLLFSGAQGLRATAPTVPSHDYAYVVVVKRGSVIGTDQWIFGLSDGGGTAYKKIRFTPSNFVEFNMRDSGTNRSVASSTTYSAGELLNIVVVSRGEQHKLLYINGVLQGVNTSDLKTGGGADIVLGVQGSTSGQISWLNGEIYLAAILPSVSDISDAAFMELSANPWQLFAPLEKPLFSAIDSIRIRGPKPRQVVRTTQPQNTRAEASPYIDTLYFAPYQRDLVSGLTGVLTAPAQTIITNVGRAMAVPSFNDRITIRAPKALAFLVGARFSIAALITGNTSGSTRTFLFSNRGSFTANTDRRGCFSIQVAQNTHAVTLTVNGNTSNTATQLFSLVPGVVMFLEIYCKSDGYDYRSNYGYGTVTLADGMPTNIGLIPPGNTDFGQAGSLGEPGHSGAALLHIGYTRAPQSYVLNNPWQLFANAEQPFWHTEFVQPKKFFPALALPVPKNITSSSVTPQVTLSF